MITWLQIKPNFFGGWGGGVFFVFCLVIKFQWIFQIPQQEVGGGGANKTKTLSKITMTLILYDNCRKGKGHS